MGSASTSQYRLISSESCPYGEVAGSSESPERMPWLMFLGNLRPDRGRERVKSCIGKRHFVGTISYLTFTQVKIKRKRSGGSVHWHIRKFTQV